MTNPPTTRPSLLVRIRDAGDAEAWSQFVRLYAPLIYRFARCKHLQDADAADLTQEVLRSVSGGAGGLNYDPQRGSFRSWLFTLAHRRLCDFARARKTGTIGSGQSEVQALLQDQPAPTDESLWDQEYERHLFHAAAEAVKPGFHDSTWQAFWQTAVEGKNGKDVARELGLTVAAVYLAKSRVMARLKQQIHEWERE